MEWDPAQEVRSVYGKESLLLAREDEVDSLELPEESKWFITNVGLPKRPIAPVEISFSLDRVQGHVIQSMEYKPEFLGAVIDLRVIGYEGDNVLCFANDGTGCVLCLNGYLRRIQFVNSSIELLGGFLALFDRSCMKDDALYLKSFEAIAGLADPRVFEDPNGFWTVIFEQMRDGLL